MTIRYSSEAERDLSTVLDFYLIERPQAAIDFLESFENTLDLLRRFPRAAPAVRGHIRRAVIHRFPYNILYRLSGDTIRVLAIAHQSKLPDDPGSL